MEGLRKV